MYHKQENNLFYPHVKNMRVSWEENITLMGKIYYPHEKIPYPQGKIILPTKEKCILPKWEISATPLGSKYNPDGKNLLPPCGKGLVNGY